MKSGGLAAGMWAAPQPRWARAAPLLRRLDDGAGPRIHACSCLFGFGVQFAADQHAADFAGAGADFIQLGVAPQAADRIVVDVAVAAQRLDRLAGHPGGFFGAVQDGADGVDVGLAGHHGRIHVGQLALHQLEFADRVAELLAVVDVRHDGVHASLHDAQRAAGQHGALEVQARHQHVDALGQAAEHVFGRHFAVVEHQFARVRAAHAQLVELLRHRVTLEMFFDQEGGHAARAGFQVVLGVDHQHVGVGAVGDPHFRAVEHPAVTFEIGAQLHADDIGAGVGFGHGERADVFAGNQFGQVFLFLLSGTVALDLVDAQIRVGAVGQADRGRGARDFFHRHDVGQVAHVGAAVFLADGDAEHAQRAHLAPQVHGELVAAVDFGGAWRDFGGGELLHRFAQGGDIFAVVKGQAWEMEHVILVVFVLVEAIMIRRYDVNVNVKCGAPQLALLLF